MSRRVPALLLAVSLSTASLGIAIAERRLQEREIVSGDGLGLRFSGDGGIVGLRRRSGRIGTSGARGGFAVRMAGGQPNLLANAGFEASGGDGLPEGWTRTPGDGELAMDPAEAHSGARSVRVSLSERGESAALVSTLEVNPNTEYTLSAWIRTAGVTPTGTTTSHNPARATILQVQRDGSAEPPKPVYAYGYTNDSPWTRHDAAFRTGSAVEAVRVVIELRDGAGTAWFDDLRVARLLEPRARPVDADLRERPGELRVVDRVAEGVSLDATIRRGRDHLAVEGVLEGAADGAAQVSFTLPVDARGWRWGDDPRRSRPVEGDAEYGNLSQPTSQGPSETFGGINQIQRTSVYPFGGVSRGDVALGIGVPMHRPRAFRITADRDGLTVTFDLGVSPDAGMGPRADFGFVVYATDGVWGFRALAERYHALFPQDFERRTDPGREGAWFFAPPLDSLPGDAPEDFGLGLNTVALGKAPTQSFSDWGTKYVPWSNARGIYASAYTHQWTFFLPLDHPVSYDDLRRRLKIARDWRGEGPAEEMSARGRIHREALAARGSAARDVNGRMHYEVYRGFHSIYQNLDLADSGEIDWGATVMQEQVRRAALVADGAGGRLDGIHLDSTSGARRWGAVNDFDRRHWANATIPLTFSYANGEPAQLGVLSMYRQISELSDALRERDMILSANFNGGPDRALGWLGADRIDYFGIEQGLPDRAGGIDRVDPLALLKRTLAYQRPITSLDHAIGYGELTPEEIDDRLQQALFYGVYPGAWVREENEDRQKTPTWSTPENRGIFARYSSLFERINQAGWEPVTHALTDEPRLWLERFGSGDDDGTVYLTIRNETDEARTGTLELDAAGLGFAGPVKIRNAMTGAMIAAASSGRPTLSVGPRATLVLELVAGL